MTNLFEIGVTNAVLATLLAAAIWPITRIWRHPALVHLLWVLVLVKLITPPLVAIPWRLDAERAAADAQVSNSSSIESLASNSVFGGETSVGQQVAIEFEMESSLHEPANPPTAAFSEAVTASSMLPHWAFARSWHWTHAAMAVWLAGSGVWLIVAFVRLIRFHLALRRTLPASKDVQDWADAAAAKLGVTNYRLRIAEAYLSPLVWPIGRPTILLSRELIEQLSSEETQSLLAHELAHLRRKDHWVRWLELAVTAAYWWHPVVWWARRMIRSAEERACDAWVVWAFPETARGYAAALFKTVQFATEPRRVAPVLASRLTPGGDLKERIEHVMNATWKRRLSLPIRSAILLAACLVLPLSLSRVHGADEEGTVDQRESEQSVDEDAITVELSVEPQSPATPAESARAAASTVPVAEPANVTARPYRIEPGDLLHVWVVGAYPDAPIRDVFMVEPGGTLPLGPVYGRVKVVGATLETAEDIITEHLSETLKEPKVQVTVARTQYGGNPTSDVAETADAARASVPAAASMPRSPAAANREELAVLREHVKFVEEQFKRLDALFQTGSRGGSAEARAMAGFELERARGDLALAEGQRDRARAHFEAAQKFAEEALTSVRAAYLNGLVTHDLVLQAARNVSEIKRRLIHLHAVETDVARTEKPAEGTTAQIHKSHANYPSFAASTESVGVLETILSTKEVELDRMNKLRARGAVSESELASAKGEYQIAVARLRQAQRALQYYRKVIELAEATYQGAMEANKISPNAIPASELRRLKLEVDLARAKYEVLAD